MTLILLFIGVALLFIGKINIGSLNAEGPPVRAAGFLLMMPWLAIVFLGFIIGILMGGSEEALTNSTRFLTILQLPVMIVCVGVAYVMLQRASEENTTPTIIDSDETEKPEAPKQQEPTQPEPEQKQPRPAVSQFWQQNQTPKRENFPQIMNTAQAARYLNISEQEVLNLIDQGKLAAAKNNYRFQISRRVLDDFIQDQHNDTASSTT